MTDKAQANGWIIDLEAWTNMQPFYDWQDYVRTGNLREMANVMTTVVKSWPYDGNPADPEYYKLSMKPAEWKEAAMKVGSAIGDFFSS